MNAGWQQLCLVVNATELPFAQALLELAGAQAIGMDDAADHALLEPAPGAMPLWPSITLRALFPAMTELSPLCEMLTDSLGGSPKVTIVALADAHWQTALRDGPELTEIGQRLALGGPRADAIPGRALLRLHFGMAFGTGRHPTTRMCLEWIERWIGPGERVLDYGCGSGILALAALVLGANAAWTVDVEPQALSATRDNARLNALESRLWVGLPDSLPDIRVDTLFANILADPLIELAPCFARHVRGGGQLMISGLLSAQLAAVETALQPHFEHFSATQSDDWVCLSATRRDRSLEGV